MRKILVFAVLLFLVSLSGFAGAAIYINEVEMNPAGADAGNEWIELYNDGNPASLNGWRVVDKDGNNYTFPSVTITNFYVLDGLTGLADTDQNLSLFRFSVLMNYTGLFNDSDDNSSTWGLLPDGTGSFLYLDGTKGYPNQPTLILNKSTDKSCVVKTDNVTLSVNVTGFCVTNVNFSVSVGGISYNFTGTNVGGDIYNFALNNTFFSGSENVDWTVFTFDCFNRTLQDGLMSFYVNNRTLLSISPAAPDGANNWYITEPIFTLINNDAAGFWYRWDAVNPILYTWPFGLENIPNPPRPQSAGTLDLHYWSGICSNESDQAQLFYVDLTLPQFNSFTPSNEENISIRRPNISVYIDELYGSNSGVNLSAVAMYVDGVSQGTAVSADEIDAIISYTPVADLDLGWHNVSVYAKDNAGLENSTNWTFNVVEESIGIDIVLPENGRYYGSRHIPFTVLLNNTVKTLEYIDYFDAILRWRSLCADCSKYNRTKIFADGKFNETLGHADSWHNITIKATGAYGAVAEKNVSFFVDSRPPRLSRIIPRRNNVVNGSAFSIKYSEDNLQQISLHWNGSSMAVLGGCEAGANKECNVSINLAPYNNKSIEFYFNITDFVRSVTSRPISVRVDTVQPVLAVNSPVEDGNYSRYVNFNISISEKVKSLKYYDSSETSPSWKSLCSNCEEYGKSALKRKSFSNGPHNLTIRAEDYAGNADEEKRNFVSVY